MSSPSATPPPAQDLALVSEQIIGGFDNYGATQRIISYLPGAASIFFPAVLHSLIFCLPS